MINFATDRSQSSSRLQMTPAVGHRPYPQLSFLTFAACRLRLPQREPATSSRRPYTVPTRTRLPRFIAECFTFTRFLRFSFSEWCVSHPYPPGSFFSFFSNPPRVRARERERPDKKRPRAAGWLNRPQLPRAHIYVRSSGQSHGSPSLPNIRGAISRERDPALHMCGRVTIVSWVDQLINFCCLHRIVDPSILLLTTRGRRRDDRAEGTRDPARAKDRLGADLVVFLWEGLNPSPFSRKMARWINVWLVKH